MEVRDEIIAFRLGGDITDSAIFDTHSQPQIHIPFHSYVKFKSKKKNHIKILHGGVCDQIIPFTDSYITFPLFIHSEETLKRSV